MIANNKGTPHSVGRSVAGYACDSITITATYMKTEVIG